MLCCCGVLSWEAFAVTAPASAEDAAVVTGDGSDPPLPDRTQEIEDRIHGRAPWPRASSPGLDVYRITRPIVVDLDKTGPFSLRGYGRLRIVMDGPGPALQLVGTHAGSAAPETVHPNVWERQRMPLIDGLEIVGQHPDARGIELDGTMMATISRVVIRRCLHGIHLIQRNRNVVLSDCHLYENQGVGVYLDDVNLHQINITGCHISYNKGGGVVSRAGAVRNLHMTGCDIESNQGEAGPPTANVLIDCRESSSGTAEVAITGCTIQHNSKSPDSANIRFIGRSLPLKNQQEDRNWGHLTITGNVLSDVSTNLHLQGCRGAVVQGNTMWMGFEHNLLVESCTDIVLGLNNLDRNPAYGGSGALSARNAVVFRDCSDCVISGLHVHHVLNGDAGIVLERCRWLNLSQCNIFECDGPGLLLRDCEFCQITNCLIRDRRPATKDYVAIQEVGGRENSISTNGLNHGLIDRSIAP